MQPIYCCSLHLSQGQHSLNHRHLSPFVFHQAMSWWTGGWSGGGGGGGGKDKGGGKGGKGGGGGGWWQDDGWSDGWAPSTGGSSSSWGTDAAAELVSAFTEALRNVVPVATAPEVAKAPEVPKAPEELKAPGEGKAAEEAKAPEEAKPAQKVEAKAPTAANSEVIDADAHGTVDAAPSGNDKQKIPVKASIKI